MYLSDARSVLLLLLLVTDSCQLYRVQYIHHYLVID